MKRLVVIVLVAGCLSEPSPPRSPDDAGHDAPSGPSANVAFVTSHLYMPATLGSDLSGADAACMASAQAGHLAGTFLAFLSTSTIDALTRLSASRGWVRVDGQPFVDLPEDLGTGKIFLPLSIDELGDDIGVAAVITAVSQTATPAPGCSDFTSGSGAVSVGATDATTADGISAGSVSCSTAGHLYCFGIGASTPVVPPVIPGARRAFVTSQPYTVDANGLATADAMCMTEAMQAGLTGTFSALLPTSIATAISRFSTSGPPWVRLDNIALAPTAFQFGAANATAPLNLTSANQYVSGEVATGGVGPNMDANSPADTCGDWTNNASTLTSGYTSYVNRYFYGVGAQCSGYPINCLED